MKKESFSYRQIITALMVILAVAFSVVVISPDLKADTGYKSTDNMTRTMLTPLPGANDLFSGEAEQDTSKLSSAAETKSRKYIIHPDDGSFFQSDSLSPENREQLRKALEDARIAIEEVGKDVFKKLNSEEFRQGMERMREELRESFKKGENEILSGIDTARLRIEMNRIKEDIRRVMEESGIKHIQSEEFRKEMEKIREEIFKAMPKEKEISDEELLEKLEIME